MSHPQRNRDPIAELMHRAIALHEEEAVLRREDFLARVDQERHRGRRAAEAFKAVWTAPLAAAAAIALAIGVLWPEPSLKYEVSGADNEGGYIRAASSEPALVRFTDATVVTAAPGARLRIVDTDEDGARVSVEQGRLAVQVTHTDASEWRFVAGPFQVHVTGTRFHLDWDPQSEQLRVDLHEGSVEVEGYADSGPIAVRAGQRFVGDARSRTMKVSESRATSKDEEGSSKSDVAPSVGVDTAEPEPSSEQPMEEGAAASPDSSRRSTSSAAGGREEGTSWAKLVSLGEFPQVVQAAERRGIQSCLSSCESAELSALADAARYTGRNDLAAKTLLALRQRFASSSGVRAAFLLGRLYESQGQHDKARGWYETSLRESPAGSFASESLAGKMRTVRAVRGKAAAAKIAQEYLNRYPHGVHAKAARELVRP